MLPFLVVVAVIALLLGWVAALQVQLYISQRIIRAFQQSAVIVPKADKKATTPPWWLALALPLLPWLLILASMAQE